MKKLFLITLFAGMTCANLMAQVDIDIEVGVSPGTNVNSPGVIINRSDPRKEFQFSLIQVKPQYYGGLRANIKLNAPFFLEGGVSYTKRTTVYEANFRMPQPLIKEPDEQIMNMSVSQDMILLPVDIGVSLGSFDITSGLRANKIISSKNQLTHLNGYQEEGNSLTWGWQMGVRYAFKHMMIGGEFQGEMHRVCDGMSVNGNSLEIRNVPGRFVFTVQYRF